VFHVKQSDSYAEGYRIAPEAGTDHVSFDELWTAFWKCCEYCGTRAALRVVTGLMSPSAVDAVYKELKDEAAGSWPFELEADEPPADLGPAYRLISTAKAMLEISGQGE
jgi:hypothetical protein